MKNELVVINPKEYGLEEKQAEKMTSGLAVVLSERKALEEIYDAVILKELNAETFKEARELRLKVKEENDKLKQQQEKEKVRIEAEEAELKAKAKALLFAPDKEKVKVFFNQFTSLQFPDLESEAGKAMSIRIKEALQMVKQLIIDDSKTLL